MKRRSTGAERPRIVIVDNYDSFTYNTLQLLGQLGAECVVVLNDALVVEGLEALTPTGLLLSAGPGTPNDAGVTLAAIEYFKGRVPILGVCLGHQAIAQAFGGRVIGGGRLMHGKTCEVFHGGRDLFEALPNPALMARYNSLLVDEASLPASLEVTARSGTGEIMALRHRELAISGVQFHPESHLSENGSQVLANWLMQLPAGRPRTEQPCQTH